MKARNKLLQRGFGFGGRPNLRHVLNIGSHAEREKIGPMSNGEAPVTVSEEAALRVVKGSLAACEFLAVCS